MPLAVSAAALVALLVGGPIRRDIWVCVFAFALPSGVLGIVDDYWPIRGRVKFAIQLALAIVFVSAGTKVEVLAVPGWFSLPLGAASAPFTVLWLVLATNAYNFMDGMDALAAGSGALFFATLAVLAFSGASSDGAALSVAVLASVACLGFLAVNRPPAQIFMGDGGALYMGALLGGLAVVLGRGDGAPVPFVSAVLAMGAFIADVTYTLAARIVRGERWNMPHKRHLYQRLVTAGWPQERVLLLYGGLALLGTTSALALAFCSAPWPSIALGASMAGFAVVVAVTERLESITTARKRPPTREPR